jgi:hypothetical protein
MKRISLPVLCMLIALMLSIICCAGARFFHAQYVEAHGKVTKANFEREYTMEEWNNLDLPNPEAYHQRVWTTAYIAVMVWVIAVCAAFVHRHWYDWVIILAITALTMYIFNISLTYR